MKNDCFVFLHIPHSSTHLINRDNILLNDSELKRELFYSTDWFTDELFFLDDATKIKFNTSRLEVDVEKQDDEKEEGFKYGRGKFYTKTFDGKTLKILPDDMSQYNDLYKNHTLNFSSQLNQAISLYNYVFVIDCHSFDEEYASHFSSDEMPDICLGVNSTNYNSNLLTDAQKLFEELGYTVKINTPFVGSYLPPGFENNENVFTMMIEINKKLYMENDNYNAKKTNSFNNTGNNICKVLTKLFS